MVLATGSLPPGTGFQKALPHVPEMPGVQAANVWSAEEVMGRAARPGHRVIVLDEGGHWRGIGTAWHLAEAGHAVTIITPDAMVGRELVRSATDVPARQTLARLGVRFVTETAVTGWDEAGAEVTSLLTGAVERIAAEALILATGNRADPRLFEALSTRGLAPLRIGDASAPRLAAAAIYEGRVAGLRL